MPHRPHAKPKSRAARKAKGSASKRRGPTRGTAAKRRGGAAGRASAAPTIAMPTGWEPDMDGKAASIEVETDDFVAAMDLMKDIADVAEELEHHPDLHLTRWNHLRITTYSHDEGRLTSRDQRLAQRVNGVLERHGLP